MFKSLLAATAAITCLAGTPVQASVGAAFDNAQAATQGGCYSTTGGHTVCWQTIQTGGYTLSLIEKTNQPGYATTVYLDCKGAWEGYGPAKEPALKSLVDAFCSER